MNFWSELFFQQRKMWMLKLLVFESILRKYISLNTLLNSEKKNKIKIFSSITLSTFLDPSYSSAFSWPASLLIFNNCYSFLLAKISPLDIIVEVPFRYFFWHSFPSYSTMYLHCAFTSEKHLQNDTVRSYAYSFSNSNALSLQGKNF